MDILFERLKIENFRSIKQLDIQLNHNSVRQIIGINIDEGGSNGSGKTNILQAFLWCLYGETFPKIPADNVTHDTYKKNCSVEVTLIRHKKEYKICRHRKHTLFKNRLRIFEDNEEISFHKTNQMFLDSLLGLNFKLFHACNIFQVNSPSLFQMQDSKRKDFFEEFITGIKFFRTFCFDKVKERIANNEQNKTSNEYKYKEICSNLELLQESYEYKDRIIEAKTKQLIEEEVNLQEEEKQTELKLKKIVSKLKKEEAKTKVNKITELQQTFDNKRKNLIEEKNKIFKLDTE